MDWVTIRGKTTEFLKKYRYVALVLAVGLLLMALPENKEEDTATEPVTEAQESQPGLQQSLEEILSQIEGAGKVRVLLTVAEGERTIYQTDQDTSVGSDTNAVRVETIIVTGTDKAQRGLVQQVNPPIYLGAVVVCQGGGNPTVKLAIVEAVSNLTGLGADKITVLKMK